MYPSVRNNLSPEELAVVNILRKRGLSKKKIHKHIVETTDCEPELRDVHNLMAKLDKIEKGGTTADERLRCALQQFGNEDEGHVARVIIDEDVSFYIYLH